MADTDMVDKMLKALDPNDPNYEILKSGLEQTSKSKSRSQKTPKHDITDPAKDVKVEVPEVIWQTVHLYRRPGFTDGQLDFDCREERKMRGDSILIFAHYHTFNEPCIEKCKEKVVK